MFSVAIRLRSGTAPTLYGVPDSTAELASVRFTERLIEVVIGIFSFCLRIEIGSSELLDKTWGNNWAGGRARQPK